MRNIQDHINSRSFKMVKSLILILLFVLNSTSHAQSDEDLIKESVVDISTVGGLTVGGAVLGLSTLSFVSVPKDHLKNIVVGGAIGMIVGVVFVAWRRATASQEMYIRGAQHYRVDPYVFSPQERMAFNRGDFGIRGDNFRIGSFYPSINYTFTF